MISIHLTSLRAAAFLLVQCSLALLLGGCSLVKLVPEAKSFYQSTVLAGRVDAAACGSASIIVAAYRSVGGIYLPVERVLLHEDGGYELAVGRGEYGVLGFCDVNRNGALDAGEPAGEYRGAAPIVAQDSGTIVMLDFTITRPASLRAELARSVTRWPAHGDTRSHQAGAIANLDDPAFSAANGRRGYWEPMFFFRQTGGNVYFLEPYDPKRTPVLFVHGASGSGQEWRSMVAGLDRSRYQAWIYQYPSGANVESMAYLLFWKLLNLQLKYRFERVDFVAHSMGGLLVRTFLLNHGHQLAPTTTTFISLSTPWGGDPLASTGVKHSPAVVPSWRDMQPEGPFITQLFARPLPASVQHYLLFGYHGGPRLTKLSNNDGAVLLSSQLRAPAQAEAKLVFGFDDDHAGILSSPAAIAQVHALLNIGAERAGSAAVQAGRLQLNFAFDGVAGAPPQAPWLLLRSRDDKQAAVIQIPLKPDDDGRSVGPVPPGNYDVGLVAPGFRGEPRSVPVSVGRDAVPALGFRLVPQGELSGYIAADAGEFSRPAGVFQPPHAALRGLTVTLEGATGRRVLRKQGEALRDLVGCPFDGEDRLGQAAFCFVGLAEGDYTLTITAEGYRPAVSRHRVVPGQPGPDKPFVLERAR